MHEEATKVWAGTWMVRVVRVLLYSQLGLDVLLLCQLAQSPLVVSYQSLCVCVGGGVLEAVHVASCVEQPYNLCCNFRVSESLKEAL